MPINWRKKNLIIVLDKKRVHLCAPVIKKNIKDSDVTIVLSHIMYWYENHQNHQVFALNLVYKNKRFSYIVWVSRHLGFFKVNSLLQKKTWIVIADFDLTKIIMGEINIFQIIIKFTIQVSFKRNETTRVLSFGCTRVIAKTKYVI